MKSFIVALAFFAVASASLSHDQAWEEFKLQFKKGFRSMVDEANRKQIFLNNLDEVEQHNAKFDLGLSTYRQGINFYSDWTWEEFQEQLLLKPQPELAFGKGNIRKTHLKKTSAPDSADWRSIMNPVKNQGQCGSCWAFGVIGSIEAAWNIAGNGQVVLSEQMLVDCSPYDAGCDGGYPENTFDFIIDNGGVCKEEDYPYTAQDGRCSYTDSMMEASISSYDFINAHKSGVDTLAESIATNGPHVIGLFANPAFQRYSSGIFDDPRCPTDQSNHAVIMVGYDMNDQYWLIRNSWSASWGEAGHIRLAMGKNMCNAEREAWVPFI